MVTASLNQLIVHQLKLLTVSFQWRPLQKLWWFHDPADLRVQVRNSVSSRKNILKKCSSSRLTGKEHLSILNSNLYLEIPLNCFFYWNQYLRKTCICLDPVDWFFSEPVTLVDMKTFQYLVLYRGKNSLKRKLFISLSLDWKQASFSDCFLSPHDPETATLLKISQELGGRGLIL